MAAPLLHSLLSTGLIAIVWSCVAFAGVLVAARAYFRATSTQGLGFEDHWIHLSYFMLVLNSVLQTVQVSDLYTIEKYYARLQQPGASLTLIGNRYITLEFCILGFFWTVLWCVKASWLAAYWRLFDGLKLYRGRWRGVALFVVVSYVGCWVASLLVCHPVSARFHFGKFSCFLEIKNVHVDLFDRSLRKGRQYGDINHFSHLQYDSGHPH